MKLNIFFGLMFASVLSLEAAAATGSAAPAKPVETSIPFVQHGGIRDWKSDSDRGLWIQDLHRNWHYARFVGRCPGLAFATAIGFDAHPLYTFDRFSSIVAPFGGRCPVQSVTTSEAPPKKEKKQAAAATPATPNDAS